MRCRACNNDLHHNFLDLGVTPLSNGFLKKEQLNKAETFYPLNIYLCDRCFLVQLEEFESPTKIFKEDYAYYSSHSTTWLKHCENYVNMISDKLELNATSQVVEIASNDGYLLQYFLTKKIKVLGIEAAKNIVEISQKKGIETINAFFSKSMAENLFDDAIRADLIIANNVLAHVPNIHDFISGLKLILKPEGVITIEVPHLLTLIEQNQFDTIYHEHFSYFSLISLIKIFKLYNLEIYDLEEISTHGGSLRLYIKNSYKKSIISQTVQYVLEKELKLGLNTSEIYYKFSDKVKELKRKFLTKLISLKNKDKKIIGYGAPAKGNTFLNYCGIGTDFIDYTVDKNQFKQGKYLPGSRIPILNPNFIKESKPDYILILPWNLKEEIITELNYIREWNGKFLLAIPKIEEL